MAMRVPVRPAEIRATLTVNSQWVMDHVEGSTRISGSVNFDVGDGFELWVHGVPTIAYHGRGIRGAPVETEINLILVGIAEHETVTADPDLLDFAELMLHAIRKLPDAETLMQGRLQLDVDAGRW